MAEAPSVAAWDAWTPAAAVRLAGCPVPWFVAAGWAIDLHLGRQTREHLDLEIAIPGADFPEFRRCLDAFEFCAAQQVDWCRWGARRNRRHSPTRCGSATRPRGSGGWTPWTTSS